MRRRSLQLVVFSIILLATTACLSLFNAVRYGDDQVLTGDARLTCSEECSLRGQCGVSVDESVYVLGGLDGVAVADHRRAFLDDTPVTIKSHVERSVQPTEGGESFLLNFYEVTTAEKAGWVAGWCVASP